MCIYFCKGFSYLRFITKRSRCMTYAPPNTSQIIYARLPESQNTAHSTLLHHSTTIYNKLQVSTIKRGIHLLLSCLKIFSKKVTPPLTTKGSTCGAISSQRQKTTNFYWLLGNCYTSFDLTEEITQTSSDLPDDGEVRSPLHESLRNCSHLLKEIKKMNNI